MPFAALLVSLAGVFFGSTSLAQSSGSTASGQSTLPQAYLDAVEDARLAEPDEIYRDLTAIVWYNPDLRWDQSRVLVAAWTTFPGYAENVGNAMLLPRELWVTAVPDLQEFCQAYRPTQQAALPYRLNQLLGLPPDSDSTTRYVVELWVEPRSLFRPSHDPDITDHEAELEFPLFNGFESLSTRYQDWFTQQFNSRYGSSASGTVTPYPWTQLGYTYDWGNQTDWQSLDARRPLHVGLSEFVVQQWSVVSVRSAQSAEDYCQ